MLTARILSPRYNVKVAEALGTGIHYQTKWYTFYKNVNDIWYRVSIGRRRFFSDKSIGWILHIEKYLPNVWKEEDKEPIMQQLGYIVERRYLSNEKPFEIAHPPLFENVYSTYWVDVFIKHYLSETDVLSVLDDVFVRKKNMPALTELQRLLK